MEKKSVNALCGISLGCYFGCILPLIISVGIMWPYVSDNTQYHPVPGIISVVSTLLIILTALMRLAGWVLMIIARVKDYKSKFAKTLMIVYIICTAVPILIGGVVLFLFFSFIASYMAGLNIFLIA